MANITKEFIKENIGSYIRIYTKESKKFSTYYSGILQRFEKDKLIMDNNACIDYHDIINIIAEYIN